MYELIKEYFGYDLYTKDQVKVFVEVRWITSEQYKEITGDEYLF